MKFMTIYLLPLACSLAFCKARAAKQSQFKHQFGNTSRSVRAGFKPCQRPEKNSDTETYLYAVFDAMAEKNPDTFKGPFVNTNFCLKVSDAETFNAYSTPSEAIISVNAGLLNAVQNDAELAGTLAHEAAHITMQNDADAHPDLANNPEWQAAVVASATEKKAIDNDMNTWERNSQDYNASRAIYNQMFLTDVNFSGDRWGKLKMEYLPEALQTRSAELWSLSEKLEQMSSRDVQLYLQRQKEITDKSRQLKSDIAAFDNDVEALTIPAGVSQQVASKLHEYFELTSWMKPKYSEFDLRREKSHSKLIGVAVKLTRVKHFNESNWSEAEADEVGYELYLKAGFHPAFFNSFAKFGLNSDRLAECRSKIQSDLEPVRGSGSHPSDCWRIYDIEYLESKEHSKEYKPLLENAKVVELYPNRLRDLQKKAKIVGHY